MIVSVRHDENNKEGKKIDKNKNEKGIPPRFMHIFTTHLFFFVRPITTNVTNTEEILYVL